MVDFILGIFTGGGIGFVIGWMASIHHLDKRVNEELKRDKEHYR